MLRTRVRSAAHALQPRAMRRAHASFYITPSAARAFHSLGLGDELAQRLVTLGLKEPTPAQRQAIPAILRREDVVIAAETGGGKTLAYLLPLLEQLHAHPLAMKDVHRPVGLILTTSQELVRQIASVLAMLHPDIAKHAVSLSSTNQSLSNHRTCPLVIATPKALLRACKPKDFAFTSSIVVDEADMLLGGGFERDTKQILATIRNQPLLNAHLNDWERARQRQEFKASSALEDEDDDEEDEVINKDEVSNEQRQTVFSAISFPMYYGKRSVRQYIEYKFPTAYFAVTKVRKGNNQSANPGHKTTDFQRTLPQLDMRFHDLQRFLADSGSGFPDAGNDEYALDDARKALLWKILTDEQQQKQIQQHSASLSGNTLVFAKSIASANSLFDFLEEQQTQQKQQQAASSSTFPKILLFHKEIDRQQRQNMLAQLDDANANVVVICTDIAARGLDTTKVRHVVQYEFANDVVSHLHRIGRTARAGTTGKVTNIVSTENALVLEKIHEAGASSLDGAFSRKRSLRKKARKLQHQSR